MAIQTVFKRYELKYMLTAQQKAAVLQAMEAHMEPDKYGRTTIRNIYFDTSSYRLIRRSIEKPVYKEKLRIRSYCRAEEKDPVFVELKKKYRSVVYKRRVVMPQGQALDWLSGSRSCAEDSQISREIDYFKDYYGQLQPVVFLCYEREAYYGKENADFRVTFDENILCRREEITLNSDAHGTAILPEGKVLMEIKCSGGIPMWMTQVLSRERIYKTSFSKYGTAYQTMLYPIQKQEAKTHGHVI